MGYEPFLLARRVRPDRVLTSNVPVVSLLLIWAWSSVSRTTWILWLQDFQSGIARVVGGSGSISARTLTLLEEFLIRQGRHVIAISDDCAERAFALGVTPDRVTAFENWAPLDAIPTRPRHNEWSSAHDLDRRFVFIYSGTLGRKHPPELVAALADEFRFDDEVANVVVGEGPDADWLRDHNCPAPIQLGFQTFESLPDVLATADVLVVLLDEAANGFSVPSKALAYLCVSRPILATLPWRNAVARVVREKAHAGIVVPPVDDDAFRAAARRLREDRAAAVALGRNGRTHAEEAFSRARIVDRFETIRSMRKTTEQPSG